MKQHINLGLSQSCEITQGVDVKQILEYRSYTMLK